MARVKYWQAINRALCDAMAEDPRVCLFGEDVAAAGGTFGATSGLLDRFGASRVRDTPISEATIVGAAVGAAMTGLRPVVEVMFMDFIGLAMDQLVNQAAKIAYMSGGAYRVPMVVRTLCGAGRSTGPQHGQSFEAWLAHVPGLKVVWPSTPADAYGLIRSAIADDDPVVVIESLALWSVREELELDGAPAVPIGSAVIRQSGEDLTMVAWGAAVATALQAADTLARDGVDVEVIDLRSISPLDEQTLLTSLEHTGRLAVVEQAPAVAGLGDRITAFASTVGHRLLASPVIRVSPPFAPVPFPPALERAYFPTADRITETIRAHMEGAA